MNQPATQEGAGGERRAPHQSRLDMLNKVGEGRVKSLNDELAEGGSTAKVEFEPIKPGDVDPENDNIDRDGDEPARQAAQTTEQGVEHQANDDAPIFDFLGEDRLDKTKVKIKVDGQEREMTVAEALKTVQKNAAADKRLEEAALAKKRAEEEAAAILANAKAEAERITSAGKTADEPQGGTQNQSGESPSKPDAISEALASLYEGDTQKSAEQLSAAVAAEVDRRLASQGATLDRAALTREVKTQMEWDVALEEFSTNHAQIADDPYLLGMWQTELNRAAKESSTPREAVKKATESVGDWLNKVSGGNAGGSKVTVGDLATRKAEKEASLSRSVTSTTSVPAGNAKNAPKPQMPSDVVADMRKARGQA